MSIRKYKSLNSLKEGINHLIDVGDFDQALKSIYDYVDLIITEPLCASQVFGSKTLDDLCQHIGKSNLAKLSQDKTETSHSQSDQSIFVYIVTRIQKSGGHNRVIEDFIRAQPEGQHVILSTELIGRSDSEYLLTELGQQANLIFESAPKVSYQQRLSWLQKRLQKICPKRVYLFNHHQDSVAVAAIQPEMKIDASFYHHGDHHLCLGVFLSHLEHIDPHPMGYHNCRDQLGIENIYIPFAIDDKGTRPSDWSFCHDGVLTTCTAARSNKIEIPYFVSYLELVPKILKATGGRHIHIGRLTPWALFKIRRGLKHYNVHSDRFVYIAWVPSVWKALHDHRVDLYIASFPYGGGLTLVEAMGAGISVALHRHIFSRVLSGLELAYSEVFSWSLPEELLDYCSSLTPELLEQTSRLSREHYEEFYLEENLREILNGVVERGSKKPDGLSDKFAVKSDEWAFWMERQLSVKRVLLRKANRIYKRTRVWWANNSG